MGTFFTRFEPSGVEDCYSQLVRCLMDNHLIRTTAFGTLNYECILDVAASHLGLKLAYLAKVPPLGNLLVWKLHGSCNVLPKMNAYGFNLVISDPVHQGYFDGEVEVLNLPEVRARYKADFALPPVMSLYAPGKPSPVASTFIKEARSQWSDWVRRAEVAIIIGARPNLSDGHVWEPVVQSDCAVWWVGQSGQHDVNQFAEQLGHHRFHHVSETFIEGMPRLRRALSTSF